MPDIIHLLTDSVANQIAAGEVVQRPGSALKELMENAIDAGATEVEVILKEAGKSLLRIVDNGSGMSETDARMSFERHATSKISKANDLFEIRTFGFRGEALASIAAIAQVEMNTRTKGDDIGTKIIIEGSKVIEQTPTSCPKGTSIAVKNLFYNVPARRNFLKSNNVEFRHCIDEFQRVAIANPDIIFSMYHNDKPVLHLTKGNLKQRIVGVFGANYDERIVPIEASTSKIKISGYIGKPQFARKTKGEQYFFVNNRFIKHPYLNHAVQSAFEDLLPDGAFPTYFIFIDVDPADIDVNIHPTKTEINFIEARLIYSFLRSAVKQSFGKFSIVPSLDFTTEQTIDIPDLRKGEAIRPPSIKLNPDYSPFKKEMDAERTDNRANWEKLFSPDVFAGVQQELDIPISYEEISSIDTNEAQQNTNAFLQIQNKYIFTGVKSGVMIIHQRKAHQRVLYENLLNHLESEAPGSQQSLFPETLHLNPGDAELIKDLHKELSILGYEIAHAGGNSFIISGAPSDLQQNLVIRTLETTLESYKNESFEKTKDRNKRLARAMAKSMSIGDKKTLSHEEMQTLANSLFACAAPESDLDGGKTLIILQAEKIAGMF